MKVKKLIELLKKENPELEVVMQKDAEGNDYSPFEDFWQGTYVPYNTWSGEAHLSELTEELKSEGYDEEEVWEPSGDNPAAIFLTPVN